MDYTAEDIGAVIRQHRESLRPKLSQKVLGERAGYGKGAGVAMSRIESGDMTPGDDKLDKIAEALGMTAAILFGEAIGHHRHSEGQRRRPGEDDRKNAVGNTKSLRQRARDLQESVERRASEVTLRGQRFNEIHDRARDDFFVPFYDVAAAVAGAPEHPVMDADPAPEDHVGPESAAEFKIELTSKMLTSALAGTGGAAAGAAVGGVAAYGTFAAAAMVGTASTGTAIGSLSGVAATNATLAFLGGGSIAAGGAGVAGGTAVLAGLVAGPIAVLAIGGVVLMTRRNKQKEAELRAQLDQAELDLHATEAGYKALIVALKGATDLLEYVAVHGGHAQRRWASAVRDHEKLDWSLLSEDERGAYEAFVTVSGCQVSVASINFGAYLTLEGQALMSFEQETEAVLTTAREQIEAIV